jgi:hypothetical protein
MKAIKLSQTFFVALFIGLFSISATYAASPAAVTAMNLRQKFVQLVQYPETAVKSALVGEVEVVFTLNDDGSVNVKSITSSNDELAKYVKDKITETAPCSECVSPFNQYYKVKFVFKLT